MSGKTKKYKPRAEPQRRKEVESLRLGSQDGRAMGWLVGYVERGGHRWIYATFIRGRADADADAEMTRLLPLRKDITRALLTRAHVLPSPSASAPWNRR